MVNTLDKKTGWKEIIERRNAKFQKLTPQKKRVALCKDVLALLDAQRINAQTGEYVVVEPDNEDFYQWESPMELSELLIQNAQSSCNTCALGALMVAHVWNTDDCEVREAANADSYDIKGRLEGFFDAEQLSLIEAAFEVSSSHACDYDDRDDAVAFGSEYDDDEPRLRAIMQNIINNKGTFVPK